VVGSVSVATAIEILVNDVLFVVVVVAVIVVTNVAVGVGVVTDVVTDVTVVLLPILLISQTVSCVFVRCFFPNRTNFSNFFILFSVRLDPVTRCQLHGLHEHRHLLDPEPGKSGRGDSQRRDAAASGCTREPDGHHPDPAQERSQG